jgi:hypothetical protein
MSAQVYLRHCELREYQHNKKYAFHVCRAEVKFCIRALLHNKLLSICDFGKNLRKTGRTFLMGVN